MIFREAFIADIPQIQVVRNSVKENMLSDQSLVTDKDCEEFLTIRGKGWVCQSNDTILGFAIADLKENNIWALFVHPDHEKKGIGQQLQQIMLEWYFSRSRQTVWLCTTPGTRAEDFYRKYGWKEAGMHGNEIKFELDYPDWLNNVRS